MLKPPQRPFMAAASRARMPVLNEVGQRAAKTLLPGVLIVRDVARHAGSGPGLHVVHCERGVLHQRRLQAGIHVLLLSDILQGRALALLRRVALGAACPALQPASDRLPEIAALERAREIAEDRIAVAVDDARHQRRRPEGQQAVAGAGAE